MKILIAVKQVAALDEDFRSARTDATWMRISSSAI
jgi:hypothetical protein